MLPINKRPGRIEHIFPQDLCATVTPPWPFAPVINDAVLVPFVPFKRLPNREMSPHLSYFCTGFIALFHTWKKQQSQLSFHNAFVIVREKGNHQVKEEVPPGARNNPSTSPLSVIPIRLVQGSHREASGSVLFWEGGGGVGG